jgi:hypothetical protein
VPVANALEPATLVEDLALHLTTADVELAEAYPLLTALAPLVILTETLPAAAGTAERWRVRGIVGLGGAPGSPEVVELWRVDPATGRLAATGRVFEPPPRPTTDAAPVPLPPSPPPPPSGSGVAAEDPSVDVFGSGLGTARLVREWVRPDEPFLPIPAGESCPACAVLDAAVAASAEIPEELRAARYRRAVHRGLHAEVVLLLERLLKPPTAAAYRDPPWTPPQPRNRACACATSAGRSWTCGAASAATAGKRRAARSGSCAPPVWRTTRTAWRPGRR